MINKFKLFKVKVSELFINDEIDSSIKTSGRFNSAVEKKRSEYPIVFWYVWKNGGLKNFFLVIKDWLPQLISQEISTPSCLEVKCVEKLFNNGNVKKTVRTNPIKSPHSLFFIYIIFYL